MDPVQILLFSVVGILTFLLIFVGVQVIFILRKVNKTLKKLNQVLDDLNMISGAVSKPVVGFTNFVEGMKDVKSLLEVFSEKLHPSTPVLPTNPTETVEMTQMSVTQSYPHISSIQERGRRFFHKDGKPLTS